MKFGMLYSDTTKFMHNFLPQRGYVPTLPENTLTPEKLLVLFVTKMHGFEKN